MKWTITGDVPRNLNKYLIVVAPHTSNWDFIIGLFTRRLLTFKSSFLAKSQLFKKPFGVIFKKLGGYPVDRNSKHNMVDQVAKLCENNEYFVLAITPEGTRGNVNQWKTGFYHIAKKTGMPLVMAAIDYNKKNVNFFEPYYVTGDLKIDAEIINSRFRNVKGKNRNAALFKPE